jgi:hypothetical protein
MPIKRMYKALTETMVFYLTRILILIVGSVKNDIKPAMAIFDDRLDRK